MEMPRLAWWFGGLEPLQMVLSPQTLQGIWPRRAPPVPGVQEIDPGEQRGGFDMQNVGIDGALSRAVG